MLLNSQAMNEKIQRLNCIDINSSSRNDDLFNNNTKVSNFMQTGDSKCLCDTHSVDSTTIEYLLPDDYVMGTFPKQLVESQTHTSRQNSISSSCRLINSYCNQADKTIGSITKSQRKFDSNATLSSRVAKRNSFYDNVPCDETPPPTPEPVAPEMEAVVARKELDVVLQDLLENINSLELSLDTDSLNLVLPQSNDNDNSTDRLNIDSAVVSPTSEDLSSLTDTPSDTVNTPLGTPKLPRMSKQDTSGSSDELAANERSTSQEELNDCVNEYGHETVWRERRDSGVGSSLTREPL